MQRRAARKAATRSPWIERRFFCCASKRRSRRSDSSARSDSKLTSASNSNASPFHLPATQPPLPLPHPFPPSFHNSAHFSLPFSKVEQFSLLNFLFRLRCICPFFTPLSFSSHSLSAIALILPYFLFLLFRILRLYKDFPY